MTVRQAITDVFLFHTVTIVADELPISADTRTIITSTLELAFYARATKKIDLTFISSLISFVGSIVTIVHVRASNVSLKSNQV